MYRSVIIGGSFSQAFMLKEKIIAMNTDLQEPEIIKSITHGDRLAMMSKCDVVFLFIDGDNAVGLLHQIPVERNYEIIFVAEKYQLDCLIKALKLYVADYITVPINNAELEEAIKKSIEIIKLKRHVKRSFYNKLQSPPPPPCRI